MSPPPGSGRHGEPPGCQGRGGVRGAARPPPPRLAALLRLGIAALAAASEPSPERVARVVLLIAGTLAAVSASRLLSPGPALAAARVVVAALWVGATGRLPAPPL